LEEKCGIRHETCKSRPNASADTEFQTCKIYPKYGPCSNVSNGGNNVTKSFFFEKRLCWKNVKIDWGKTRRRQKVNGS